MRRYDEPLFFSPWFEEKIWGGTRLETLFGKSIPQDRLIGESWELSAIEDKDTAVAAGELKGKTLEAVYEQAPLELAGPCCAQSPVFPLLIKFIDANDHLSIQVHPDDKTARSLYGAPFGKTECWYVAHAGEDGSLGIGFKKSLTRKKLRLAIGNGTIESLLNIVPVKTGEVFFIPAGTVHAILGDVVIYEVQQSSDITLRLYDWNRTDASGRARKLHVEEAVAVADCRAGNIYRIEPLEQVRTGYSHSIRVVCPYFALEEYASNESVTIDLPQKSSFQIVTCISGVAKILYGDSASCVTTGSTALLPAAQKEWHVRCEQNCRFLLTTIPDIDREIVGPLLQANFSSRQIAAICGQ